MTGIDLDLTATLPSPAEDFSALLANMRSYMHAFQIEQDIVDRLTAYFEPPEPERPTEIFGWYRSLVEPATAEAPPELPDGYYWTYRWASVDAELMIALPDDATEVPDVVWDQHRTPWLTCDRTPGGNADWWYGLTRADPLRRSDALAAWQSGLITETEARAALHAYSVDLLKGFGSAPTPDDIEHRTDDAEDDQDRDQDVHAPPMPDRLAFQTTIADWKARRIEAQDRIRSEPWDANKWAAALVENGVEAITLLEEWPDPPFHLDPGRIRWLAAEVWDCRGQEGPNPVDPRISRVFSDHFMHPADACSIADLLLYLAFGEHADHNVSPRSNLTVEPIAVDPLPPATNHWADYGGAQRNSEPT